MISVRKNLMLALSFSFALAGCAIHPLPDDVTGVDTHTIARQTRCEARGAVQKNLVDYLREWPNEPELQRLGIFFADSTNLKYFKLDMFPLAQREVIARFAQTAIVYDFNLDISEVDNLDATVDLLNPFHKGVSSAALGAGLDRTREASRAFTLSDHFQDLFLKIRDEYCADHQDVRNDVYPIVGRIGIDEAIHEFIKMTLFDELSGPSIKVSDVATKSEGTRGKVDGKTMNSRPSSKATATQGEEQSAAVTGPPTMTDTLVFTTKISGSAAPKIVFTPVGTAAHVMDASLLAMASRTDVHRIVLGFAVPASPDQQQSASQTVSGLFVTVRGDETKQAAGQAVDQAYLRRGVSRGLGTILPLNVGE